MVIYHYYRRWRCVVVGGGGGVLFFSLLTVGIPWFDVVLMSLVQVSCVCLL
jgi:hypothetical protein